MSLPACLCLPSLGFVCSLHKGKPANPVTDSSKFGVDCPWNPDELPDRLRGYGHRGADQDGYDGEEWITPQEDLEAQMIEATRVLLDAVEIEVAQGF
jgi:hypothetical protein